MKLRGEEIKRKYRKGEITKTEAVELMCKLYKDLKVI